MHRFIKLVLAVVLAIAVVRGEEESTKNATLDWATPVLNAVMCPLTKDPWDCGRQQATRMIDVMLADVELTKQEIKDEADADLADRIAHRAFSESELPEKEKPSAVMTTLDNYVTNGILSVLGRKNHNMKKKKPKPGHHQQTSEQQHPIIVQVPVAAEHYPQQHHHQKPHHHAKPQHHEEDDDDDDDDDEEEDDEPQQFEGHYVGGHHHGGHGLGHKKPHHGVAHHKPIHHKHGRDLGVTRGKKHKKKFKKALMKLLVLAAVLKVKLEFFLKVLATHLQVKFFIIAFLGLLLNAAKFWIDLKKGHNPQKVIYYEHAQHQHHYDDHGDEGWGGGGGYWKRSFDTVDAVAPEDEDEASSFDERAAMQAYRQSRVVAPGAHSSAQDIAYSQQKPANV